MRAHEGVIKGEEGNLKDGGEDVRKTRLKKDIEIEVKRKRIDKESIKMQE